MPLGLEQQFIELRKRYPATAARLVEKCSDPAIKLDTRDRLILAEYSLSVHRGGILQDAISPEVKSAVLQASAPERPSDGGRASEILKP